MLIELVWDLGVLWQPQYSSHLRKRCGLFQEDKAANVEAVISLLRGLHLHLQLHSHGAFCQSYWLWVFDTLVAKFTCTPDIYANTHTYPTTTPFSQKHIKYPHILRSQVFKLVWFPLFLFLWCTMFFFVSSRTHIWVKDKNAGSHCCI